MKKWLNEHKSLISILLLIIAIILLGGSLILKAINVINELNPLIATIGCMCTTIGFTMTLYEHNNNNSLKRGFEPVVESKRKNKYYHLPTRGTKNSSCYDFYSPNEYMVKPNEIVKIWTDIKAYMRNDETLLITVRSSMGGKFMLANTIGIIDSDYYGNVENDGNIGIFLKNISNQTQLIKKGDRIAQGKFEKYLIADNDYCLSETRTGGFGSTNENRNA